MMASMKTSTQSFFVVLLIWISSFELAIAANYENTHFNHLTTKQGLSQKTIQTIYQDHIGYMWLGTQEGLNRYDGKEVVVYRKSTNQTDSLTHDVIRDIAEDAKNQLWIATRDGLNQFIPEVGQFKRFNLDDNGDPVTRFNSLYLDSLQRLWVGTDGHGLFVISYDNGSLVIKKFTEIAELLAADVRTVLFDSRGRLWIGTDHQGLFRLDKANKNQFNVENQSLSHNSVRTIYEDSRGSIWVGTRGGGLNRFDELKKTFIAYRHQDSDPKSLSHDRVYEILEDQKGRLWIATDNGLGLYNAASDDFTTIVHKSSQATSLSHNRVLSIFEDKGGMMWFGTMAGLNLWDPNLADFEHYRRVAEDDKTMQNNTVYSLAEIPDQSILIGTFGNSINVLNPQTKEITPFITTDDSEHTHYRVMSLMVDTEQRLWVGTLANGVSIYSLDGSVISQMKHVHDDPSSLSANGITDMLQDSDGNFWISTYNKGINKLASFSEPIIRFNLNENTSGLRSENIYGLLEDEEGFIWIATDGGGLSRLDRSSNEIISITHQLEQETSLSGDIISSIFQDSRGLFWIGTFGNGLNLWHPNDRRNLNNRFEKINMSHGLLSNSINAIIEDESGNIWVSSNKGVNKIDKNFNVVNHINFSDTIHENEFNQGAALASKTGRLFFGGLNGVSAFSPNVDHINRHHPNLKLKKILVGNHPLELDVPVDQLEQLQLNYKDYLVTFEFIAFDFAQPEKNQYQYKLDGFDPGWINLNSTNRATFTNLPSGNYVLKVKGTNGDKIWSDSQITLPIRVFPAPWNTWWAYSIYTSAFCFLLLIFIRYQARRLAAQDLFHNKVQQSVSEKTELYIKNYEALTKKVEYLKNVSFIDEETKLASQIAFIEESALALKWFHKINIDQTKNAQALLLFILNIEPEDPDASKANPILETAANSLKPSFDLIARWNQWQIAGFVLLTKPVSAGQVIENSIKLMLHELNQKILANKISVGYTLVAHEFDQSIEADSIMMLSEHLMYFAKLQQGNSYVGIEKMYQPLTSSVLKQTLSAKNPSEVEHLFAMTINDSLTE